VGSACPLFSLFFLPLDLPATGRPLLRHAIPDKFPKLRFGFIEANSSWIPYVIYDLKRRIKEGRPKSTFGRSEYAIESDLLKTNRMYVTCQSDEDLAYILKYSGEDNLIMGSDYTHKDQSMDHEFARLLQERADNGDIPQSAVDKILCENPRTFYGL
jgi:predicted TIM-barrel fold metal-dependent hydrolase